MLYGRGPGGRPRTVGCGVERVRAVKCVVALTLVVGLSRPAGLRGGETVLRMRFDTGSEHTYSFTSTLRQKTSTSQANLIHEMTLVGTTRQVVVAYDADQGTALIGQLGKGNWSMTEGADRIPVGSRDQTWCSAWRVDRHGRALRRGTGAGGATRGLILRTLGQIGESPQACATFPDDAVSRGSRWEGDVLLPLLGMRLPGTGESVVSNLTGEAGSGSCVMRTRVSSGSSMAHTDWMPDKWLPDTRVTGTAVSDFDIERGTWRRVGMDLQATLDGEDFEGEIHIQSTLDRQSVRRLPTAEAEAWIKRVTAFDALLTEMCRDGGEGAENRLERLAASENDTDWQKGLGLTLALVRKARADAEKLLSGASGKDAPQAHAPRPEASATEIYKLAAAHAAAGRFEEAVREYDRFMERAGTDCPGWMRVLARYRQGDALEKLGNMDRAAAVYRTAEVLPATDDYSLKLRKKAGERADALADR
jgi:hypothetical protein